METKKLTLKQKGLTGFVLVAAAIAAVGGILFGFDTGVISGAMLFIVKQWNLTHGQAEFATSSVLIGAVLGAIMGGALGDRLGRKKSIIGATILFLLGTVIVSVATGMGNFTIGRVLIGAAIGVASFMVPLYISEMAPPAVRGGMVSLNQFAVTVGILVSYGVNYVFSHTENWHAMFAVGVIPGLVLLIGMYLLPESPRWLVSVRRKEEAAGVLKKIRGRQDVAGEVSEIEEEIRAETGGRLSDLWAPALRVPVIIGLGLAVLQQVTGVNTVVYYAPAIFKAAGLESATASIAATTGLGVVNVAMTAVAIWLLDRKGRRPLLLWSVAGMTIALFLLGAGFAFRAEEASPGGALGRITAISLMLYMAFFAIGLGPVFWLLIAEIYPLRLRAVAMSAATVANWAANYLVAATFLTMAGVLGKAGVFWFYAIMGLVTFSFVRRLVPETKGKTLEEVQEIFAARRAGKLKKAA
ncbi:MAG TPA: sugar porter family MFS transporter [Candidatus Binatia bacterium]|nr:sugar porter family MFS transporter [Candidatus Binatia bacterium]